MLLLLWLLMLLVLLVLLVDRRRTLNRRWSRQQRVLSKSRSIIARIPRRIGAGLFRCTPDIRGRNREGRGRGRHGVDLVELWFLTVQFTHSQRGQSSHINNDREVLESAAIKTILLAHSSCTTGGDVLFKVDQIQQTHTRTRCVGIKPHSSPMKSGPRAR